VVYGRVTPRVLKLATVTRMVAPAVDQQASRKLISDKDVDAEDEQEKKRGRCKSNDTHVIALALVTRARLLCSADHALHADFKNPLIISKPPSYLPKPGARQSSEAEVSRLQ